MNMLAAKMQKDEQLLRLGNWGRWCRSGNNLVQGYTTWGELLKQFLGEHANRITIDELDAMKIEYVISTLDIVGRDGIGWGEIWAFCLRVEHVERSDNQQRPQSLRAKHVSRKFNRPCASRTYRKHLFNARKAVFSLVEPL